jgi:K+ transporter
VLSRQPRHATHRDNILGVLSLIFWALLLVISLKYCDLRPARRQPRRGRHPGADMALIDAGAA